MIFLSSVLALIAPLAASAQTLEWVAASGEWFEATNWSPAQVPTATDDVLINNGGTCDVVTPIETFARNLDVGVDGGSGTLQILSAGFNDDLFLDGGFDIGVTESGVETSIGTVLVSEETRSFSFSSNGGAPFRIGVSETDGAAHGTLTVEAFNASNISTNSFSAIRIGVSEGAGLATGRLESVDFEIKDHPALEIGVATDTGEAMGFADIDELENVDNLIIGRSYAAGHATGTLIHDFFFSSTWRSIELGVSSAGGNATGLLTGRIEDINGDGTGNLDVGVATGNGRAEGSLLFNSVGFNGTRSIQNYVDVRVGVATGAGDALGIVRSAAGIRADSLEVGTSAGTGVGTGEFSFEKGLSRLDNLTLGSGSTLQLGLSSPPRGVSFPIPGYSAINADAVSIEPGATLAATFSFIPPASQGFELIHSGTMTGITGDFTTVDVRNLNQGYTATPMVVVDGGIEKYVLDVVGTPVLPEWTHPGTGVMAGDWFDVSNWSSPIVPTGGDPVSIRNGGEATADGGTAAGPIEVFSLAVGVDGTSASWTVENLGIEPVHGISIARINPGYLGGGTSTGVAHLTDVSLAPKQVPDSDPTEDPEGIFAGLRVGVAAGTGIADGSLVLEGGTISMPDEERRDEPHSELRVGVASLIVGEASPTGIGRIDINPGGGMSTIETHAFRLGRAEVYRTATSGTAEAIGEASVANLVLRGSADIATGFCNAPSSTSVATVPTVTWDHVTAIGMDAITIARTIAGEPGCTATASAPEVDIRHSTLNNGVVFGFAETGSPDASSEVMTAATLTDVLIEPIDGGDISFGTVNTAGGMVDVDVDIAMTRVDAYLVPNDTDFTTEQGGNDFRIARLQLFGEGQTTVNISIDARESDLRVDEVKVGDVDSFVPGSTSTVHLATTLRDGSTVAARSLCVGCAESGPGTAVNITSTLDLLDSSATLGAEAIVGELAGDSAVVGNQVTATLRMEGSSLVAAGVMVGATNPMNHPMDADLILNPSWVDTDLFTLGTDGDLTMHLAGTDRITATTLGAPNTYAAIDADDAVLGGEIIAHFDFLPAPGMHVFDLIVTDSPTALDETSATLRVEGLDPGFSVDFFGVAEDGVDVLRLIISGSPVADLAIAISDGPDPVSVGEALTYTLDVTNLGPNAATLVTVVDTLPPTTLLQSAGGTGWTCDEVAGTVTCTRPALAVGAAPPIAIVVTSPNMPSELMNSASVSAAVMDSMTVNNSDLENTAVISASDVSGTKEVAGDLVPGGGVTYTIVLVNSAGSPQVDDPINPEFIDVLPGELSLLTANADSGVVTQMGNTVRWDGTIAAGATVVLTIDARINSAAAGEVVVNQGEIFYDADGDGTNDTVAVTDDPEQAAADDPTVFTVGVVVEVPTLPEFGLVLLVLLLGTAGVVFLRRR